MRLLPCAAWLGLLGLPACGGGSSKPPEADIPCTPGSGTDLELYPVASGLSDPVLVTAPPGDPRLFILEQRGRIRVMREGVLVDTPFLDIEGQVLDGGERGLLGLAFHPDYAGNGRFFVYYTRDSDTHQVVAEYAVSEGSPDEADPTSERVLLDMDDPASNHNGGMLAFGPRDGLLYISTGDGGGGGDEFGTGQNLTSLVAKILRVDVDGGQPYGIPSGNPYADSENGAEDPRPEIWVWGLRNPWRFSFDRQTGDLYIADVGQGAIEEIDVQPAGSGGGENYGWSVMEGTACYGGGGCDMTGLELPVAEYAHDNGRCSVSGGYAYRGSCIPDIAGWYFYADYCTSEIWTLQWPDAVDPVDRTAAIVNATSAFNISAFGESASGELYVVSRGNGTIFKVIRAGTAPTADAAP
jgi:glucose/arabinose dehydrogenase